MGIFGSRKKTVVSSVVYNLAGDVNDRPNFLKTTVLSNILFDTQESMGQTITGSYLRGPGITLPRFARWAKRSGYNDTIGQISSSIVIGGQINEQVLIDNTPHAADESISILAKRISYPDYGWWAEQWMLENHPDQFELDWEADFLGTTEITITMPGGAPVYSFPVTNWDLEARYLYYLYTTVENPQIQPLVPGTPVDIGSGNWPSISGWTTVSSTSEDKTIGLVKTTVVRKTYSDGRPAEETTNTESSTGTYVETHQVFTRTVYKGVYPGNPNKTYSSQETMYQDQTGGKTSSSTSDTITEDIGGGVTRTTVTTVTTEVVALTRVYRVDTQDTIFDGLGQSKVVIYRKNSGNPVFDAMFDNATNTGDFYPFIPIRLNNQFLSDTFFPDLYAASKKGYKKAFGRNYYDKLVDIIADNESIGDIDFAYITFGVSLNVIDNSALRYVYAFFETLLDSFEAGSPEEYAAYRAKWIEARDFNSDYEAWDVAQSDPTNPLYGTPKPAVVSYPSMPNQEIQIKNGDQYNIRLTWNSMQETAGIGLGKPGVKKGDLWWEVGAVQILNGKVSSGPGLFATMTERSAIVHLWYQETATSWKKITFEGLRHINTIYKGKAVEIDADEAILDAEESGFVVPLHEGIFNNMPIVDRTQSATANSFILFNCYQVVKKKWYQTGLFKIVIIIIAIVISIYTGGAGGAAAGGLLGSNAAVGAALGLAAGSLAAVIVGAIANAIAAMLLVAVIQKGAVALFGDKLGTIIGAIASVIALNVASGVAQGQTVAQSFGNLTRADSILALTNAVGEGYAAYVQADTLDALNRTETLLSEYKEEAFEIQQQFLETFGSSTRGIIDPFKLTEAAQMTPESRDSFLARTLLVGSEIVELSTALLDNFTEVSLSTDLPK